MPQQARDHFDDYPKPEEVDEWIEAIWDEVLSVPCKAVVIDDNGLRPDLGINYAGGEFRYVKFTPQAGQPFFAYWQPVWSAPAPLLVHVPGYGAEISMHPDLVMQGYNVIHANPLGYVTPDGPDLSKQDDGNWPVLPDTVSSGGRHGYRDWLVQCVHAVRWAQSQPGVEQNRVSFFGTSQGGGGALLLGSLFRDRGVRCIAADVPFLTNFPLANGRGAYYLVEIGLARSDDATEGWRGLGFVDTLSHARRLTMPVLLTGGDSDQVTPAETIESLFVRLPGIRSYTRLHTGHRYTREFAHLSSAWFRIFA